MQAPLLRMQLHADGYNISHVATGVPDTGHCRLTLERPGCKAEVIERHGGQTEVWPSPPRGSYTARLELISNTAVGQVLARGRVIGFAVP